VKGSGREVLSLHLLGVTEENVYVTYSKRCVLLAFELTA
jgi:hypothetical protein